MARPANLLHCSRLCRTSLPPSLTHCIAPYLSVGLHFASSASPRNLPPTVERAVFDTMIRGDSVGRWPATLVVDGDLLNKLILS